MSPLRRRLGVAGFNIILVAASLAASPRYASVDPSSESAASAAEVAGRPERCSDAHDLYRRARAADSATDDARTIDLYQRTVEKYELCKDPAAAPLSHAAMTDGLDEFDAKLALAYHYLNPADDNSRAAKAVIAAGGTTWVELCRRNQPLAPDIVTRLWLMLEFWRKLSDAANANVAPIECTRLNHTF